MYVCMYIYIDRKSEIDYENRLLLKKILTIDLNPGYLSPKQVTLRPFTATGTLNKAVRVRAQSQITEENLVYIISII